MEEGFIILKMEIHIWDSGKMIDIMDKESIYLQMVIFIKGNLLTEESMEEEFISIKQELCMMASGSKIKNLDSECTTT
jgi:hypothetical protein